MAEFKHCSRNGIWHSICLSCYGTAAKGDSEDDLTVSELKHECDLEIRLIARRLRERLLMDGWKLRDVLPTETAGGTAK